MYINFTFYTYKIHKYDAQYAKYEIDCALPNINK